MNKDEIISRAKAYIEAEKDAGFKKVSMSAISHQLRVLKNSRLVKYRKQGKSVLYSLDDDHIKTIINMGVEHIEE